jgi:ribonucleoside-triphosphate reductase
MRFSFGCQEKKAERKKKKMEKTKMGKGVKFERIRRITGYLVGTLDKWNDAKKAEEKDRVKHNVGNKTPK